MNSKKILAFIVLTFLLSAQIEGLTIKSHLVRKISEHNKVQKLVHESGRHVKEMILNHLDQEQNPLFALFASDPELLDSAMNGKPLSEDGVKKVKDFFLSNGDFKTTVLSTFGQEQGADCFNGLTDAQKDKVFKVLIDHMPFANMFVQGYNFEPNVEQIVKELLADQELGPILIKCGLDTKKD